MLEALPESYPQRVIFTAKQLGRVAEHLIEFEHVCLSAGLPVLPQIEPMKEKVIPITLGMMQS